MKVYHDGREDIPEMKWLIASDIHGSAFWCERLISEFKREKADRLLLLGDILYHGPRNELPRDYAPKRVISMLSEVSDSVFCVRGNCEAEVDQMVLDFPVMADYAVFEMGKNVVYATHGHIYNEENVPPLKKGDVLLCGHTHIPKCKEVGGIFFLNPGSVSIPKENSKNGYMIYEEGVFLWKTFDGDVFKEYKAY